MKLQIKQDRWFSRENGKKMYVGPLKRKEENIIAAQGRFSFTGDFFLIISGFTVKSPGHNIMNPLVLPLPFLGQS